MKMMIFSDLIHFFLVMAASSSPVFFKAMQIKSAALTPSMVLTRSVLGLACVCDLRPSSLKHSEVLTSN